MKNSILLYNTEVEEFLNKGEEIFNDTLRKFTEEYPKYMYFLPEKEGEENLNSAVYTLETYNYYLCKFIDVQLLFNRKIFEEMSYINSSILFLMSEKSSEGITEEMRKIYHDTQNTFDEMKNISDNIREQISFVNGKINRFVILNKKAYEKFFNKDWEDSSMEKIYKGEGERNELF